MKKVLEIITVLMLLTIISCESDEIKVEINPKSVTNCELSTDPEFVGMCLSGATSVLPNEIITYASKSTANFSEILWTIESGNIEILNIENSIVDGFNKSIATIQFNSNFSGGSIKVQAINNSNELAEISSYQIKLDD